METIVETPAPKAETPKFAQHSFEHNGEVIVTASAGFEQGKLLGIEFGSELTLMHVDQEGWVGQHTNLGIVFEIFYKTRMQK